MKKTATWGCVLVISLALAGCPSKESGPQGAASGTPTVAVATAPAASSDANAPAAATTAAVAGAASFAGDVTTEMAPLTVPTGERPWTGRNAEGDGIGASKVKLVTHPDGRVEGTVSGSLGALTIVGRAWDDSVSATLLPTSPSPSAFSGTVFASRKGKNLEGTLYASSTDGAKVRTGALKLTGP